MTSLLRKKHRTTRPSLLRTSRGREQGAGSREPEGRLRLGAFALLAVAVCVSNANAASELKWRSERADATSRSTPSTSNSDSSTSSSTSLNASSSSYAPSGNPLRFVRPQTSSARVDTAVQQAAFEDDAPRLTSGTGADTHSRSIVVNRDEAADSFRSAQLPAPGATGSAGNNNSNTAPADRLRSPFGDTPEPPTLETPQFESPTKPDMGTKEAPPQDNLKNEPQRNPAPSNTKQQPTTAPPRSGQFQPVLPSGPQPPLPIETGPAAPLTPTAVVEGEKTQAKESCDKSLENLRAYTVDKVKLNIGIGGTEGKDYPFECSIDDGQQFKGRCWDQTTYMWKASAMCHKPLYFEDEQLERYGHSFSPCFQPFVSGAHFFCTLPVLPYCMGVEPPCECIYALGYYRPGSCAPYMCNPIPLSPRGALFEAGAVTGAAAALP
jgi:hypothetical protein